MLIITLTIYPTPYKRLGKSCDIPRVNNYIDSLYRYRNKEFLFL